MQQLARSARIFSSPTVLIVTVWSVLLVVIAIGPIDYSNQPSGAVLAIVGIGISLFILAQQAGAWCFRLWFANRAEGPAPRTDRLSLVVGLSSCAGIAGIGLIALDRIMLSGVGNSAYAELLRCSPDLIDIVEIKRTPLLYIGYLFFSFGFASIVLFLLKGERIRGWAAVLAQLSILSPVGYALLYAGRMPILFVLLLTIAAVLVRLTQGRRALPEGHHLFVKMIVLVLVFGIYSSAIWLSRRTFCTQISGVVRELQHRLQKREADLAKVREEQREIGRQPSAAEHEAGPKPSGSPLSLSLDSPPTAGSRLAPVKEVSQGAGEKLPTAKSPANAKQGTAPADAISAGDIGKMIVAARTSPTDGGRDDVKAFLLTMDQAWHTKPSGYVIAAIESGRFSPGAVVTVLSTYFYLTHGVRILDTTWRERDRLSPHWGVYQIGALSPILRVFFPQSDELLTLRNELQSAGLYGFFPTVWAAAYVDFGAVGAVIYILIWGFAAGWSAFGVRHSALATPALLLTFITATILLSPVQGPLGITNSALVLVSIIIVGLAADFGGREHTTPAAARRAGHALGAG
jgi:hypothetical protein